MKRVTEPELMIQFDQVKAYMESDFSATEEDLIIRISDFLRSKDIQISDQTLIIDLGCGPGNISERLARHWPESKIIGIDDSVEMIKVAKGRQESNPKVSCLKNLSYIKTNISAIAKGETSLISLADLVISNSCLHHIHEPLIFFRALLKISKKGAIHYHRDLRRPKSMEEASFIQKENLPLAPKVLVKDFLASLCAAHTKSEVESYLSIIGLESFIVREIKDRYIDIMGRV